MAYFYFGKPRLKLDRSGSRLPGLSAARPAVTAMSTVCNLWVNSSLLFGSGNTLELHNNHSHPFELPKQGAPDEGFAVFHANSAFACFPPQKISLLLRHQLLCLHWHSFYITETSDCFAGSSTACIVVLDRRSHQLHTCNLGDSGFLVVRGGEVVHRSDEQQHYFNTPFQLSIAPPEAEGAVLSDRSVAQRAM